VVGAPQGRHDGGLATRSPNGLATESSVHRDSGVGEDRSDLCVVSVHRLSVRVGRPLPLAAYDV